MTEIDKQMALSYLQAFQTSKSMAPGAAAPYLAVALVWDAAAKHLNLQGFHQSLRDGLFNNGATGGLVHTQQLALEEISAIRDAIEQLGAHVHLLHVVAKQSDVEFLGSYDAGPLRDVLAKATLWHLGALSGTPSDKLYEVKAEEFFHSYMFVWEMLADNPGPLDRTRAQYFLERLPGLPGKFVVYLQNLYNMYLARRQDSSLVIELVPEPTPQPTVTVTTDPLPPVTPLEVPAMTPAPHEHAPATHPLKDLPDSEPLVGAYSQAFHQLQPPVTSTETLAHPLNVVRALQTAAREQNMNVQAAATAMIKHFGDTRILGYSSNSFEGEHGEKVLAVLNSHLTALQDFSLFYHFSHSTAGLKDAATLPATIIRIAKFLEATTPSPDAYKEITGGLRTILLRMLNVIFSPDSPASPIHLGEAIASDSSLSTELKGAITGALAEVINLPDQYKAEERMVDFSSVEVTGSNLFQQTDHTAELANTANLGSRLFMQTADGHLHVADQEADYSVIFRKDPELANRLFKAFDEIIAPQAHLVYSPQGVSTVLDALSKVAHLGDVQRQDSVARAIIAAGSNGAFNTVMCNHPQYRPYLSRPVVILTAYINFNRYMSHPCAHKATTAVMLHELSAVITFLGEIYTASEIGTFLHKLLVVQAHVLQAKPDYDTLLDQLLRNLNTSGHYNLANDVQNAWREVMKAEVPTAGEVIAALGPQQAGGTPGLKMVDNPQVGEDGVLINREVLKHLSFMTYEQRAGYFSTLNRRERYAILQAHQTGDGYKAIPPMPAETPAAAVVKAPGAMVAQISIGRGFSAQDYMADPTTFPLSLDGVSFKPDPKALDHITNWAITNLESGRDGSESCNSCIQDPTGKDVHVLVTMEPARLQGFYNVLVTLLTLEEYVANNLTFVPYLLSSTVQDAAAEQVVADPAQDEFQQTTDGAPRSALDDLRYFIEAGPVLFQRFYQPGTESVTAELFPFTHRTLGEVRAVESAFQHLTDWAMGQIGTEAALCKSEFTIAGLTLFVVASTNAQNTPRRGVVRALEVRLVSQGLLEDNNWAWVSPTRIQGPGEVPSDLVGGDVLVQAGADNGALLAQFDVDFQGEVNVVLATPMAVPGYDDHTLSLLELKQVVDWATASFIRDPQTENITENFQLLVGLNDAPLMVTAFATLLQAKFTEEGPNKFFTVTVEHLHQTPVTMAEKAAGEVAPAQVARVREMLMAKAGLIDPAKAPALAARRQELQGQVPVTGELVAVPDGKAAPSFSDYVEELQHAATAWAYNNKQINGPVIERNITREFTRKMNAIIDLLPVNAGLDGKNETDMALFNAAHDQCYAALDAANRAQHGERHLMEPVYWFSHLFKALLEKRIAFHRPGDQK